MEDWDIERVIKDYAAAAERMVAAGLDGFELECYGHLIDGFWSPATARRTDEYGGSLENRMRFGRRILEAIRARIGTQPIVGLRIAADEDWEHGLSREEGVEICKRFKDSGLIDFLNIVRGHNEHDSPMTGHIPLTGMPSNPHLDFAGEVRAETRFPTFHASRISDVATARHAIASGKLDMVGMTRAHIADPHIMRKILEKREEQIRPCVGATYCLDRIYENGSATCIHNPATGEEQRARSVRRHRRCRTGGTRSSAGLSRARAQGRRLRSGTESGWSGEARLHREAPHRNDEHHRLARG